MSNDDVLPSKFTAKDSLKCIVWLAQLIVDWSRFEASMGWRSDRRRNLCRLPMVA
jgi:hypothetical protein